jgi:hypothetical protein
MRQELATGRSDSYASDRCGSTAVNDGTELFGIRDPGYRFLLPSNRDSGHRVCGTGKQ